MKKKTDSAKRKPSSALQGTVLRTVSGGAPKPQATGKAAPREAGDIVELILQDHLPLKKLIKTLKDADLGRADKESSLEQFVPLLLSHAKAEQQSLYFQMKGYPELRVESFEGDVEHAMAEQLAHEINATPDDDEWCAKVKVLAESVEHHIEEEEGDMLPHVKSAIDLGGRAAAGAEYVRLKEDYDFINSIPVRNQREFSERRAG